MRKLMIGVAVTCVLLVIPVTAVIRVLRGSMTGPGSPSAGSAA